MLCTLKIYVYAKYKSCIYVKYRPPKVAFTLKNVSEKIKIACCGKASCKICVSCCTNLILSSLNVSNLDSPGKLPLHLYAMFSREKLSFN